MTIESILEKVELKYKNLLCLTANENILSEMSSAFQKSSIFNRYLMGHSMEDIFHIGNFAQVGIPEVMPLIYAAEEATKKMLNAQFINLNCLSGIHAMMCCILCTTEPGDIILTIPGKEGGHFATCGIIERTGRIATGLPYKDNKIDFEMLKQMVKDEKAKLIYLDSAAQLEIHPLHKIRECVGNDIKIIYDASHTMGLIMGGNFQNPLLEGADIITANTHKTLPGPHHGMLAFKSKSLGEEVSAIMQNCLYSSTHTNEVLALAVTLLEMEKWGKEYTKLIVENAIELGRLLADKGLELRQIANDCYTNTHQIHLFVSGNPNELVERFFANGISVTTSKTMGDRLFVRIGLQEITRRGALLSDMKLLAELIERIVFGENVKNEVLAYNNRFQDIKYGYSMGDCIEV